MLLNALSAFCYTYFTDSSAHMKNKFLRVPGMAIIDFEKAYAGARRKRIFDPFHFIGTTAFLPDQIKQGNKELLFGE
jgi:hypothetical protein